MRRQRGTRANIATVRWITYELSAWYEPLLMIDLMMRKKLELCLKLLLMEMSMLLMTIVVG